MFFSGSTGLCGLLIPKCRGCRGPGGQEVHGLPQRGAPHAAQGGRGCHRQEEEQTRLLGKGNLGAINKLNLCDLKTLVWVITKDYCITGRANLISCAVGLR